MTQPVRFGSHYQVSVSMINYGNHGRPTDPVRQKVLDTIKDEFVNNVPGSAGKVDIQDNKIDLVCLDQFDRTFFDKLIADIRSTRFNFPCMVFPLPQKVASTPTQTAVDAVKQQFQADAAAASASATPASQKP